MGGRQIEALPNAPSVKEQDGGTAYLLFRRDRVRCIKGGSLLRNMKIAEDSPTNRVVAACCNSAMYIGFDEGPFWNSIYRGRFTTPVPDVEMRVQTKSKPAAAEMDSSVPSYTAIPIKLGFRLTAAWIRMLLGR
jgi:hypothetical protein